LGRPEVPAAGALQSIDNPASRGLSTRGETAVLNSINYLTYLAFSVFITIFVAHTLSRNGLPFLIRGFKGNKELAVSTNHLLVVGFYLVNVGFVLLRMTTGVSIDSFEQIIVYQTSGLGIVLVVLGFAHFFNMYVIHRLGQSELDFQRFQAPQ
jgi:sterol desaturase/sphingolipid hydroxylase (fatty acid hydroxylase superfamily)